MERRSSWLRRRLDRDLVAGLGR